MQSTPANEPKPEVAESPTKKAALVSPWTRRFRAKAGGGAEDWTIGMALGSPSQSPLVPRENIRRPPAAFAESEVAPAERNFDEQAGKVKNKRWKKLGALFKARPRPSDQTPRDATPFYQFKADHAIRDDETDDSAPPPPPPKDDVHVKSRSPEPPVDKPGIGCGRKGIFSSQVPAPGNSVRPSDSGGQAENSKDLTLNVEFPNLQLERYSVMFGNVLDGPQKTLAARRSSKALDKLKIYPERTDSLYIPLEAKEADPNLLAAHHNTTPLLAPPRRATSPNPVKSPNFSLFPTAAPRPIVVTGRMPFQRRTPLHRSSTAPPRLSPMHESFTPDGSQPVKSNPPKRRDSFSSPVETSASTTRGPTWSTDGSVHSPMSSVSSMHDDDILFDLKKLSVVTESRESQYEMIKPDVETVELYRTKSSMKKLGKSPLAVNEVGPAPSHSPPPPPRETEEEGSVSKSDENATTPKGLGISTLEASQTKAETEVGSEAEDFVTPCEEFVTPPSVKAVKQHKKVHLPKVKSVDSTALKEDNAEVAGTTPEIVAAAVLGTLDYMETQSEIRAASPMFDRPDDWPATPTEKSSKLLVIPKKLPISKYSKRAPSPLPITSTPPEFQPLSPPRRVVTEPAAAREASVAVRLARAKAAELVKSTSPESLSLSESSLKVTIVPPKSSSNASDSTSDTTVLPNSPTSTKSTVASVAPSVIEPVAPPQIAVARQVSLSRKTSKKLHIPPPAAWRMESIRVEAGEKMVNSQEMKPTIVDAARKHKPGKSLALVIENAELPKTKDVPPIPQITNEQRAS